jgi:predicted xylose isomerase-like sugar epimerase
MARDHGSPDQTSLTHKSSIRGSRRGAPKIRHSDRIMVGGVILELFCLNRFAIQSLF